MASIKNKPKKQHLISSVYVKQFKVLGKVGSFTYCLDTESKYKKTIREVGTDDKIFTSDRYYNDNTLDDPYAIEKIFGRTIESNYAKIIADISSESLLSVETIRKIIGWIVFSKLKSPYIRNRIEREIKQTVYSIKSPVELNSFYLKSIGQYAKKLHLRFFTEPDLLDDYGLRVVTTINCKAWRIMKAPSWVQFISNDNPGFSLNVDLIETNPYAFSGAIESGVNSLIVYVLSPIYCLLIEPFESGTPLNACAMNTMTEYESASPRFVRWVNIGVVATSQRLIFSNNKKDLERACKNF